MNGGPEIDRLPAHWNSSDRTVLRDGPQGVVTYGSLAGRRRSSDGLPQWSPAPLSQRRWWAVVREGVATLPMTTILVTVTETVGEALPTVPGQEENSVLDKGGAVRNRRNPSYVRSKAPHTSSLRGRTRMTPSLHPADSPGSPRRTPVETGTKWGQRPGRSNTPLDTAGRNPVAGSPRASGMVGTVNGG